VSPSLNRPSKCGRHGEEGRRRGGGALETSLIVEVAGNDRGASSASAAAAGDSGFLVSARTEWSALEQLGALDGRLVSLSRRPRAAFNFALTDGPTREAEVEAERLHDPERPCWR